MCEKCGYMRGMGDTIVINGLLVFLGYVLIFNGGLEYAVIIPLIFYTVKKIVEWLYINDYINFL